MGDWAAPSANTVLYDICCGTGTIGITLARRVAKVWGGGLTLARRVAKVGRRHGGVYVCAGVRELRHPEL